MSEITMNPKFEAHIEKALDINEKGLIRKVMNGVWEVDSVESTNKYEVVSFINDNGNTRYGCGCPAYQFSDKTFPEKICKHCMAVAIFEKGYIKKDIVDEIIAKTSYLEPDEVYKNINSKTVYSLY